MRKIRTTDGQFANLFSYLYTKISVTNFSNLFRTDINLKDYINLVTKQYSEVENEFINDVEIDKVSLEKNNKVLLAFSGGKDSLAVALKLKSKGYEVILFHVMGINSSYTNEWQSAEALANRLGLKIVMAKVTQSGSSDFLESPIKNALILALMVDFGIKHNVSKYALGNEAEINLSNTPKMSALSDAIELYNLLEDYYKHYIKGFELIQVLTNTKDSYNTVLEHDYNLLAFSSSCMTPYRWQNNLRKQNSKKFNYNFVKGCGVSCYKCAQELMVLDKAGIIALSNEIKEKCIIEFKKFDANNYNLNNWI